MALYFKPLRRKLGVVTLAMGCVFLGGWMRSHFTWDHTWLRLSGTRSHYSLNSVDGRLWYWKVVFFREIDWGCGWICPSHFKGSGTDLNGAWKPLDALSGLELDWRRDWAGFHCGTGNFSSGENVLVQDATVPYWSIVVPFTLLSAYLLLSKPRASTSSNAAHT